MKKFLRTLLLNSGMSVFAAFANLTSINAQVADNDSLNALPELIFRNPVLLSGVAGKEGAIYKFPGIAPGLDGRVLLKKFSTSTIKVNTVDNAEFGWDNAFQPEFGMEKVTANSNWYIDFELSFIDVATGGKKKVDRFVATSLDVDGDGSNVAEYVSMQQASSVTYSTVSYLQNTIPSVPVCSIDGKASNAVDCTKCGGTGKEGKRKSKCRDCDGVGKVYFECKHPFEGSQVDVQGPTDFFANIDTAATQVMATYIYNNKEVINFRIGAQSGSKIGGAGVRLNSLWFKSFSLAPPMTLPVNLTSFTAMLNKETAVINWTAANEENFNHYVVERSTDGTDYTAIATVFSMAAPRYAYKDANVASATGVLYYRLRLVDKTKESTFYQVRVIRFGKEEEKMTLSTYPNPATDLIRVSLPNNWQNKAVSIELFTASGIKLQSQQINNASQTETVQIGKAPKGVYIIKASCEGQTAQQRIIKN